MFPSQFVPLTFGSLWTDSGGDHVLQAQHLAARKVGTLVAWSV